MTKVCNNDTKGYPYKDIPEEEYKIKVTVLQVLLSIIFFGMILVILSNSKEVSLSFGQNLAPGP